MFYFSNMVLGLTVHLILRNMRQNTGYIITQRMNQSLLPHICILSLMSLALWDTNYYRKIFLHFICITFYSSCSDQYMSPVSPVFHTVATVYSRPKSQILIHLQTAGRNRRARGPAHQPSVTYICHRFPYEIVDSAPQL